MLQKFAVTNYRGFEKRIELDLTKTRDYEFNTFAIKDKIIKNGIIYGPNGSGKSNLGLAIFDIVNHLTQKWKKPDYYENFAFAGAKDVPVTFEYTFKLDEYVIEYSYSKNIVGLLVSEKLLVNTSLVFEKTQKSFFIDKSFPMEESVRATFKENANGASIINYILLAYPLPENHCILRLLKFVNTMLWFKRLDEPAFIGFDTHSSNLDEYIIQNNLAEDFSSFLNEVSEQRFKFITPKKGDKNLFCDINGAPMEFHTIASTGTNALQLLYFWLKRMDETSFVFIDEFDAFYHFRLSRAVCRRLFELDCQIFLTSHNTMLMTNDLLRPDCNFILNHNEIRALHDCTEKELRQANNIEKLYRGGTFDIL